MKKWLHWIVPGIFAAWVAGTLWPHPDKTFFHLQDFGRLPVVFNGRVQPLDSVARNSLLAMRTKQTLLLDDQSSPPAIGWLAELLFKPEQADNQRVFRIDHPELLDLLELPHSGKYFSFNQIAAHAQPLEAEARRVAKVDSSKRTTLERQVMKLYGSLDLYYRLENTLQPAGGGNFAEELAGFQKAIGRGFAAIQEKEAGKKYSEQDLAGMAFYFKRYSAMDELKPPLAIPPLGSTHRRQDWTTTGRALLEMLRSKEAHPALLQFAQMSDGYRNSRPDEFNGAVAAYRQLLQQKGFQPEIRKGREEFYYNAIAPFYTSIVLYVVAFVLACLSWFNWSEWLNRAAFRLLLLAFAVHTTGLVFRMYLEGRPPVTNLYSSAIFVGWGAVLLGLILERIFRDGIGAVTASSVGFITLIIAHNLSLDGDTMEMLRAVLDTNFWLATHVVMITLGYASVFVSGFLAILYIVRGFFTTTLTPATAKALTRMVYGIVCFSTLFSFVGTILGGIWADQSWGRFWGWDPKENGALIIVLWCAIILHARWGGLVRERGLMNLAVFGNIVTSYSWFGVNMLGVGLHSYGFMDSAFKWLIAFVISQLGLIGIGLLPARLWKSFHAPQRATARTDKAPRQAPAGKARPVPASS